MSIHFNLVNSTNTFNEPVFQTTGENSSDDKECSIYQRKMNIQKEIEVAEQNLSHLQKFVFECTTTIHQYLFRLPSIKDEIKQLRKGIFNYKIGTETFNGIQVPSDDGLLTLENGNKTKATEYTGKIIHTIKILKSIPISNGPVIKCNEDQPLVYVISGKDYIFLGQEIDRSDKNQIICKFQTNWQAGRTGSSLKIDCIALKSHLHKQRISDLQNCIEDKEKEVKFLEEQIHINSENINYYQKEVKALKFNIEQYKQLV